MADGEWIEKRDRLPNFLSFHPAFIKSYDYEKGFLIQNSPNKSTSKPIPHFGDTIQN